MLPTFSINANAIEGHRAGGSAPPDSKEKYEFLDDLCHYVGKNTCDNA